MEGFKDRSTAGVQLALRLVKLKGKPNSLILAIPRGGVVVGYQIAKFLKLPLDIVITRKIRSPKQPELALGAVDLDGNVIWDQSLVDLQGVAKKDVDLEVKKQIDEIRKRYKLYRQHKEEIAPKDKVVVLVDDGVATGATTLAAINYLKSQKVKKIIIAVPVISKDIYNLISQSVDEIVALKIPDNFQSVGQFFQKFDQIQDAQVLKLLKA